MCKYIKANEFPVSNLDAVSRSENVFHTVNIYFEIHIYKSNFAKKKRKHFSEKKHKKKQEKNKKGMYETHYALYFRRRAWERERRGGKLSY